MVFTTPWSNKYSLMLQYIGILSSEKYGSYARAEFLKAKASLLLQFQYDFDLIHGEADDLSIRARSFFGIEGTLAVNEPDAPADCQRIRPFAN